MFAVLSVIHRSWSVMRQRDEFGFSWDLRKLPPFPTLFGALDALFRRGDEIPPDEPRRGEMFAAQQHRPSRRKRAHGDVRSWLEHHELALREGGLADGEFTLHHVHRALAMVGRDLERRTARDLRVNIECRPQRDDRRAQSKGLSGNDGQIDAVACAARQGRRGVVHEGRLSILVAVGQRHPALNAVHIVAAGRARGRRCSLGMRNAAPGRHPVHVAGADLLHRAEAVAMLQGTREQIGHRRKRNMGVRPHVDPTSACESRRAYMIEKNERPHHLPDPGRQHAAHDETAEVALARINHMQNRHGQPPSMLRETDSKTGCLRSATATSSSTRNIPNDAILHGCCGKRPERCDMVKKKNPTVTRAAAEAAVRTLLSWAGDDPMREGLRDTPKRVVNAYTDWFSGYAIDPGAYLRRTFEEVEGYDEMVVLRDISFESFCEHHMAPIIGRAHVGYLPSDRVVGISKLARVVDGYARRFQVQEKLTAQIAGCINEVLKPRGVGVVIDAVHQCMTTRGVHKRGVSMVTSKMLGTFRADASTRAEFLRFIGIEGNGHR